MAIVAAAVAVGTVLVPVGAADDAAAWTLLSGRCPNAYPTSATFHVVPDATVPAAYLTPLRNAAAAWDAWSAVTGVSVKVADPGTTNVPAGALPVSVTASEYLAKPTVRAQAGPRCSNGTIAAGSIAISTALLGQRDDRGKQITLAHEMGHIFGLANYPPAPHAECSSIMYSPSPDGWNCTDYTGPRMDDIAGVVSLWRPQSTPGFPADSRIATPRLPNYFLQSSSAYWSGYLNNSTFAPADPNGYSNWTYVKDKANDGWGWLVNAGSSLCLVRYRTFAHMDYCESDAGRWAVSQRGGKTLLQNKQSRLCLGIQWDGGGPDSTQDDARLIPCPLVDAGLDVRPSGGAARPPRALPEALGDQIVGTQSKKCITATGGAQTPGTGLSLRGCTGTADQRWVFQQVSGGYALVVYEAGNPGEDPEAGTPELCARGSGGTVTLQPCARAADKTWIMDVDGTIRNAATGTCLNVSGGSTSDGAPLILWGCARTDNMLWSVPDSLRTGMVSLAPLSSSTEGVLGTAPAPAGDANQRTRVVLTKNSSVDQVRWGFSDVQGSNGGGLLRNLATGTCLRWNNWNAQAVLDDACDGSDSSYRWAPTAQPDGTMTLRSQYSGECLDVSSNGDAEGQPIVTYACGTNFKNQMWRPVLNVAAPVTAVNVPTVTPNLAMFGAASQSSTYGDGTADKAIDGNPAGAWSAGSTTHTQADAYAWWQVDLGDSYPIGTVTLYNRTDCCSDRSSDLWVFYSASPFPDGKTPDQLKDVPGVVSYRVTGAVSPQTSMSLSSGSYRYVRVQLAGTNYLSLSEVTISERR